jgi:serine phosphatase RsbU (regulator of sigma subunit)/anti-sigma regulatory factor (Ser/Thr protein kinase)
MLLPQFPRNRHVLLLGSVLLLVSACVLPVLYFSPGFFVQVSAAAVSAILVSVFLLLLHSAIYDLFPLNHPSFAGFVKKEDSIILLLDKRAEIICYAGPKVEDYFTASVRAGKASSTLLHRFSPDERETLVSELSRLQGGEEGRTNELKLVRPDKDEAWLSIRFEGIRSRRGILKRIVFVCRDVTARRDAQLRLVQAREYEVEVGARIQQSLLLGQPETSYSGMQIGAFTLPSQRIDGDFVDFFSGNDSSITDFVLGDVMGKGVPAALLGAAARTELMRSRLGNSSSNSLPLLSSVIANAEANLSVELQKFNSFVTLIYGRVDRQQRLFEFIDCGHTSIIHYDAVHRHCWLLKGSNMPLGFVNSQDFQRYIIDLNMGDILFVYSDGITEAVNSEGELFGEERLMHLVRSSAELDAEDLLQKIKMITFAYSAGAFRDDVTGIAIKLDHTDNELEIKTATETFPQSMESLRDIRAFSRKQLSACRSVSGSGNEGLCDTIELVAGEAASNILRHQESGSGTTLSVSIRTCVKWIAVSMEYRGNSYEWYKVSDPDVTSYQQSGYGLYLMESSMDSVTLEQGEDDRLRLVMMKHIERTGNEEQ